MTQHSTIGADGHAATPPFDQALLNGLEFRLIGPHRGGRAVAVAGHPTDPMTFYFGACAGGVWKTTDGGTIWENVSDGFFRTAAVGALAVAASDPNVIYAGTGESTIRGNVSHGDGVYKSTDAGKTWTNVGLGGTRHIAKVAVHPRDPDLVYVAAFGHAWGPNPDRGLYRSKDGGKTWERVLFRGERAGAIDLSMDPTNPRVLYCALWEAQRRPYSLTSGGEGSGLFKSTDGGDTWTEITRKKVLPEGVLGKIGVAVSPARPERVWALIEAEDGALFRSDDGGETWARVCEEGGLRRRAWYYTHVFADPQDAETVWVLNLACWKSTDGGKTFAVVPTPHGDDHALWIDPQNPRRMIEGNDGGACVTFNGGLSWSTIYNQPTAQFYHALADDQIPYRVYGSQQDNTAIRLPSASARGAITATEWVEPGGGESGYIAVHPNDPEVVFGGAIGSGYGNGRLLRYDGRTGQERNITVWPEVTGMGNGAEDLKYRFQWTFPLLFSPHDPGVLYAASNVVHRSTDEGGSWEVISPDLTRADPETLGPSGGPITKDNTGAEAYATIFAFVESPHAKGLFWAGSDDGLIHLSRDSGATWGEITPPAESLPERALISVIEPSPHDPATAYVAATRYKSDDWRPYLLKTADYGETWTLLTGGANGIPAHDFTRVIREDPQRRGLLYAGTETGVYVSFDDGAGWQPLKNNLPVVPIHDLIVKGDDLVVATHGRSFWILDDLSPLRQLDEGVAGAGAHLFAPRATPRMKFSTGYGNKPSEGANYRMAGPVVFAYRRREKDDGTGAKEEVFLDAGKNPPDGLVVYYALQEQPQGDITLTFLTEGGEEIRAFSSKPEKQGQDGPSANGHGDAAETEKLIAGTEPMEAAAEGDKDDQEPRLPKRAGTNRFVWNLRAPAARKIEGAKDDEEPVLGPAIPPGNYQVRLRVGDRTLTQPVQLLKDPRVAATDEDLRAQYELLIGVRDKLSETNDGVNRLRSIRGQVEGWERRAKDHEKGAALVERATALKGALTAIEEALIQVKADSPLCPPGRLDTKLAALPDFIGSADFAPTKQAREVYESVAARVDEQLARLGTLIDEEVAAFNALVRDAALPAVAAPAVGAASK